MTEEVVVPRPPHSLFWRWRCCCGGGSAHRQRLSRAAGRRSRSFLLWMAQRIPLPCLIATAEVISPGPSYVKAAAAAALLSKICRICNHSCQASDFRNVWIKPRTVFAQCKLSREVFYPLGIFVLPAILETIPKKAPMNFAGAFSKGMMVHNLGLCCVLFLFEYSVHIITIGLACSTPSPFCCYIR